jgi:hypothetical protein
MNRSQLLHRHAAKIGHHLVVNQLGVPLSRFRRNIAGGPVGELAIQELPERFFARIHIIAALGLAEQLDQFCLCLFPRTLHGTVRRSALAGCIATELKFDLPTMGRAPPNVSAAHIFLRLLSASIAA